MALAAIVIALLVASGGTKSKPAPRSAGGGGLLLALLVAAVALGGRAPAPATTASSPSVNGTDGLAPAMQVAVADLDAAMGGTLDITSGYRSAAEQARVCASTSLPCAPPGRSLHQQGLAIDVANWQQAAAALAAHPEIPLCQPLPARDPVHFSHLDGGECS